MKTSNDVKLNDFLLTLKIHNKDLDACFNDAVAVHHVKALIQSEIAAVLDLVNEKVIGEDLDPNMVHVNNYPSWWDAVNGRLHSQRAALESIRREKV